MMEEWISLELKLISCRDLKAFNFFQKLSVYAVVVIFNDEEKKKEQQQQQKTLVDGEGGGNPEWNHSMQFDLKAISLADQGDHLFLKFKLRCGGVVFGNRSIGEVRVPLKELIEEFEGSVRYVSYQVRSSDGKPNGVLNFSYRVRGKPKKKGTETPRVELPSRIQCCHEKIDVNSGSNSCLYPSLDDIHSPLPGGSVPCPQFNYYQETHAYTKTTPPPPPLPLQLPTFAVGHRIYYQYPCPSPLNWYTPQALGYGYNVCGYPAGTVWPNN